MAKKQTDDLVDAGSEYSFPASDPPSYMGGAAVAGSPPEDGEPPHERVVQELTDPDEAKPAEHAAQGTNPGRSGAIENASPEMPFGRSLTSADTGASSEGNIDERIRRRAYEIWESEGRSGDAEEHWFRAKRELRGGSPSNDRREDPSNSPSSSDASKMVEQVKVAMDARNARSKQSKRAGTTGKKEAAKNTGPSNAASRKTGATKGEPRRSK